MLLIYVVFWLNKLLYLPELTPEFEKYVEGMSDINKTHYL